MRQRVALRLQRQTELRPTQQSGRTERCQVPVAGATLRRVVLQHDREVEPGAEVVQHLQQFDRRLLHVFGRLAPEHLVERPGEHDVRAHLLEDRLDLRLHPAVAEVQAGLAPPDVVAILGLGHQIDGLVRDADLVEDRRVRVLDVDVEHPARGDELAVVPRVAPGSDVQPEVAHQGALADAFGGDDDHPPAATQDVRGHPLAVVHDLLGHRRELGEAEQPFDFVGPSGDQPVGVRVVEREYSVGGHLVALLGQLGVVGHQLSATGCLHDEVRVLPGGGHGRGGVLAGEQIGALVCAREPLRNGDDVDRLACRVQFQHLLPGQLVQRLVEIRRVDVAEEMPDDGLAQQRRTDQRLLGLDAVRRDQVAHDALQARFV